jgi:hypothetical protein
MVSYEEAAIAIAALIASEFATAAIVLEWKHRAKLRWR